MLSMGRLRRHMAAVTLCALLCARISHALDDVARAGRILALAARALEEVPAFQVGPALTRPCTLVDSAGCWTRGNLSGILPGFRLFGL